MRSTDVFDLRELLRHLQKHESERDIQAALGLGRRTIRKYRRWAQAEGLSTPIEKGLFRHFDEAAR